MTYRISDTIASLLADLRNNCDEEVSTLAEVLPQYIQDYNDEAAYREVDRKIDALAKAFSRMEKLLERTLAKTEQIENSVDSFYGE